MDNFDYKKYLKEGKLFEGEDKDDPVVAKGDGLTLTKSQLQKLENGQVVKVGNGYMKLMKDWKPKNESKNSVKEGDTHKFWELGATALKTLMDNIDDDMFSELKADNTDAAEQIAKGFQSALWEYIADIVPSNAGAAPDEMV